MGTSERVTGLVFDVQRYSIHDGPGIRTTVFLKGCPLRCLWCHNPESMAKEPEVWLEETRCIGCRECERVCEMQAHSLREGRHDFARASCRRCGKCAEACYAGALEMVGREMDVREALAAVEADRPFYEQSGGGVTLSGGEPLLQPRFTTAFLAACRERKLHTTLDTSGYAPARVLDRAAAEADLVLFDIKHMDSRRHRELTGVGNTIILANLQRLLSRQVQIVLRVPIVPGCNDEDANFGALAAFLHSVPTTHVSLELLPYHRLGEPKYRRLGHRGAPLGARELVNDTRLERFREILATTGVPVRLPK